MAVFFLVASPSCKIRIPRYRYRRMQVVCEELKEDYRLPRGTAKQVHQHVAEKLRAEGISITEAQFDTDQNILRAAYRWLTVASSKERDEIYKRSRQARIVLDCFIKDGLRQWSDLKLEEAVPAAISLAVPKPRIRLEELEAGKELAQVIGELTFHLESILGENETLKAELQEHQQCVKRAADDRAYIAFVEDENKNLEARMREASERIRRAHSDTLEEIAQLHPEIPQLALLAQQLKAGAGKREQEMERLRSLLPASFAWQNEKGGVVYERRFLDLLGELPPPEQEQVIKQLATLCREGPGYASLHTRKPEMRLPHTPHGALVSRGADDLRFTWHKQGDAITVYWLFRKGDSRVRYSEA